MAKRKTKPLIVSELTFQTNEAARLRRENRRLRRFIRKFDSTVLWTGKCGWYARERTAILRAKGAKK